MGGGRLINLDVKKIRIATNIYADGTSLGKFNVDPLLVGLGVGKRF